MEDELRRRALIDPSEWGDVYNKKIRRGAGMCSMYAVMGQPSTENRSVGSWGTRIQHVYRSSSGYSATYIYTVNGKIDAWQD